MVTDPKPSQKHMLAARPSNRCKEAERRAGPDLELWEGRRDWEPLAARGELECVGVTAEVGNREKIPEAKLIGAVSVFSGPVPYAFPIGLTSLGLNSMSGLRMGEFLSALPQLGSHG